MNISHGLQGERGEYVTWTTQRKGRISHMDYREKGVNMSDGLQGETGEYVRWTTGRKG